jgi:hypothetical protein
LTSRVVFEYDDSRMERSPGRASRSKHMEVYS